MGSLDDTRSPTDSLTPHFQIVIFDDPTTTRLMGSIDANRLVLLCGAGLSIPARSSLMTAARVAQACYDKYRAIAILPAAMRDDNEQLATHFHGTGELESVFIDRLVPWNDLVGVRLESQDSDQRVSSSKELR